MATFAFIHGAGDVGWYWHLVEAELRARGHDTIAPDLPIDDEAATLNDYADAVVSAIGDRAGDDLVVVGMSFGGYTAPIVAGRTGAAHLALVAPMIPKPGESAEQMFANTGYEQEPQDDHAERQRDEERQTRAVHYRSLRPSRSRRAAASRASPHVCRAGFAGRGTPFA